MHGTAPGLPKVGNQTKVLIFFQDGGIEHPQTWTGGNDAGYRDRDLDPTMVRKRAGHHRAGQDGGERECQ